LSLPTTPSQTVGPFLSIGLPWPEGPFAVSPDTPGAIRIAVTVRDGAGEPVPDALIETWQADPEPSEAAGFRGFGRSGFEEGDGSYEVWTLKPGPVPAPDGGIQAPHIDVSVFARGLLNRCVTRIYFADEEEANAADPVLASVPAARRETLLAQPTDDGYQFDIRLQGPGETVFFAI
jgi:protocatechuate 3,4-dioxygenase, alpha subunit